MDRFEELKKKIADKGYFALTPAEKEEYTKFKGTKTTETGGSEVTIKKSELDGIMSRLRRLETEEGGLPKVGPTGEWTEEEEDGKVYLATVRKYRPTASDPYAYVIDWKWDRDEWNEKLREVEQIYKFTLLDEKDKKAIIEMPLVTFCKKAEREEVEIIEKKIKKLRRVVTYVNATKVKYADYKSIQGDKVPLVVTKDEIKLVIKLQDGRVLILPENRINA